MKNQTRLTKIIRHAALLVVAASMAACGGGDDSSASTCNNPLLLIPCILDGLSDTQPEVIASAGTDSSMATISGPVSTNGTEAEVARFDAFEPNNSFDNANIVSYPFHNDGISIGSNLSGTDDDADTFIFTPNHTGLHSIYVCAETCAAAADDGNLSIMLLDQSQTTLDSTVSSGTSNIEVAAELIAGMAYYVQVRSSDFTMIEREYNLVIVN
jgi:hypothetical protein